MTQATVDLDKLTAAVLQAANLLEFGRAYAEAENGDTTWLSLLRCIDTSLGDILSMIDEARGDEARDERNQNQREGSA